MLHSSDHRVGVEWEILVAAGPDSARIIPVTGRQQSLGRSPSCGIRIDDPKLEPHHAVLAEIDRTGDALTAEDLVSTLRSLGGAVESHGSTFRVGSSLCWVQPAITPLLTESPAGATKPFHRSPQSSVEPMTVPVAPRIAERPSKTSSPPWSAIVGGVVTGLIVAGVTGQWLFAIFSLVTAGIAGTTWLIQRHGYRRAVRRWNAAVVRNQQAFDRQCLDYARHLADRRRERHRYLGELLRVVLSGEQMMWAKRQIDDVCIGFGSRQVEVVLGARPLIFNDIPVTVDVSPGRIIGIYGPRSMEVSTAIVLRLAMEIGPADWRLLVTEGSSATRHHDEWRHLHGLAHLRMQPLTKENLDDGGSESRHDVIVVADPAHVAHRQAVPFRYLESHRASLIVCAPTQRELPATCTDIVDSTNIELDGVSPESARNIVAALARWHDPDAQSLSLPRHVRLVDITCAVHLDPQSMRRSWLSNTSRVALGVTADGLMSLDLVADGPHMVVVGTTGSGKSEFLRSLVASMCVQMSPVDVNFILFDYKGGAAFDACVQFPHVVGVVTDLDRHEANGSMASRALSGIEAELRRRESVLRKTSCGTQEEYQRQRTLNDEPMARLVIVVDELAALRDDAPEVVSALIAIAQRGRSLGLHLVVATQRPGTELTPDVMANAALRVALRLQNREDSLQVIGDPSAAAIPHNSPGRAFVVSGSTHPEEFQSLMVSEDLPTLVGVARSLADTMRLPAPRQPWCQPLPVRLVPDATRERFTVGVVDDPASQQQFPLHWDLRRHLLVTAGPSAGKTWALYTLAAIARSDTPETRMFFLSGRGDRNRQTSWIAVSDRERVHRLLHHVLDIIERRCSGRELNTQHDSEQIVVMIDDVDVWRQQHTDDRVGAMQWDLFERIVVEGPAVKVTCVFTASQNHTLSLVLRTRIEQQWQAGNRPGSFSVSATNTSGLLAQVYDPRSFADDFDQLVVMAETDREAVLTTLTRDLVMSASCRPGAFGIRADTLGEAVLDTDRAMRLIIVGTRTSGRTTVLSAVVEAWRRLHPDALVIDGDHLDDEERILTALEMSAPVLIAIDDADRQRVSSNISAALQSVLSHGGQPKGVLGDAVSIVATTSPQGVRSQPDHWLQTLRRHRCGVLLGRCAEEDGDLLGHYSRYLEVIPRAMSRGLWIDDGQAVGVVQFHRRVPPDHPAYCAVPAD